MRHFSAYILLLLLPILFVGCEEQIRNKTRQEINKSIKNVHYTGVLDYCPNVLFNDFQFLDDGTVYADVIIDGITYISESGNNSYEIRYNDYDNDPVILFRFHVKRFDNLSYLNLATLDGVAEYQEGKDIHGHPIFEVKIQIAVRDNITVAKSYIYENLFESIY